MGINNSKYSNGITSEKTDEDKNEQHSYSNLKQNQYFDNRIIMANPKATHLNPERVSIIASEEKREEQIN